MIEAMSTPRARPTFEQPLRTDRRSFFESLEDALRDHDGRCRGRIFDDYAILRIRAEERRFWSPALHIHVEERSGEATLCGKFSPSSPIWTAFVAIYVGLACVAIGAACYGGAQMTLEETPWAFWIVPGALALAAFTYGAAFVGQGLGSEDMYELRDFVTHAAD